MLNKKLKCKKYLDSTLTTYIIHENGSKKLLMAHTNQLTSVSIKDDMEVFLKQLVTCALDNQDLSDTDLYIYVRCADDSDYFTKDVSMGLVTFENNNKDVLLSFYDDDDNNDYYILGGYNALDIFYTKNRRLNQKQNAKDNSRKDVENE